MATPVYPLYDATVNGENRHATFGPDKCLPNDILPPALPDVWDTIPVGNSIAVGDQVFSSDELYICIVNHTKASFRPESDLNNWIRPGRPLTRLTNSSGGSTSTRDEGLNSLRFRFNVSETTTTGTTVEDNNGTGTVTYNLNTSGFGGGPDSGITSAGFGLDVTGRQVDLNYADPEMLFTLSKQTPIKDFIRTDGTLTSINFELPPASGTGNNIQYTQTFNRDSSGVLTSITIGLRATPTTALATKTFNRTGGVLTGITIS